MSREVRHVFLDMSKAFDKVRHEGLLFKLKQNGISGQILNLLTSDLDKRKQRVLLNGCESHWAIVESGVPQGSVLGPLLFLIYINDLEKGIKSKINFFADDPASELNYDLKFYGKCHLTLIPTNKPLKSFFPIKLIHPHILHYILTTKKYAVLLIRNTLALS